jgi:hypothetical protein
MSSWTSAPPVSLPDEGDVLQIEAVEKLRDQPSYPGQRQVGVGVHRVTMHAERQRRRHASVTGGQVIDRSVPREASIINPCNSTIVGPSQPVSSYFDRPEGQLDLLMPVRRGAVRRPR